MRIKSVQIKNFRAFKNETICLNNYTCLVGPNGAGKSTILTALNIFFRQYQDSKTDLSRLSEDDFHHKNTDEPINITVTFEDLSENAKADLSDYVRQNQLIVSATATYDPTTGRADVRQFGHRLGMEEFRHYFSADKAGAPASELKSVYADLRSQHPHLPVAKSKGDMAAALQDYEANNPNLCVAIPSEDQFYGATKGANKLSPHLQWIFLPAAKDITEESQESRNSGLGQLLTRTVRSRVSFSEKIQELRNSLKTEYERMLAAEQSALDDLSKSIERKLKDWEHPEATARVLWTQDPEKSVRVEEPWAHIRIGERGFESELARFGHGMQRSYMLTLLQELADTDASSSPTLILAIEEPELYQHPPQARYLADLLNDLSKGDAQIAVCTHSPLFVPGDDFETVRLVREAGKPAHSQVSQIAYSDLANTLKSAGQKLLKESGILAKLYPTLNPTLNEMFFCRTLILVEGLEDVAYVTSYLTLNSLMARFRRQGCHIVPVSGKSELIKPLAMAKQLGIPVYVMADADTDEANPGKAKKHEADNAAALKLLGHDTSESWPTSIVWKSNLTLWPTNIMSLVAEEIGPDWKQFEDSSAAYYGNAGGLKKNPLAISRALESAWENSAYSASLRKLTTSLIEFAESNQ